MGEHQALQGWILYKDSQQNLKPEAYEIYRFLEAAEELNIDIRVVQPEQFDLTVTREDQQSVLLDDEPVTLPHFVLPRMGAGSTYFALAVIRHLERLGVYAVNSSHSIETVKDKLYTQQILAQSNLPVPKTMLVKFPVNVERVAKHLGFPVVVKTLSGSQGKGVFLSESKMSFEDLMKFIETTNKTANIILQEYIESSKGRDIRVVTIGGEVVACMQRRASDDGFKANFSNGGFMEPFEATAEIQSLAIQTGQILGLDIAGIDLLFAGDHFKICEANSSPGFEGIESCSDIKMARRIFDYVREQVLLRPKYLEPIIDENDHVTVYSQIGVAT